MGEFSFPRWVVSLRYIITVEPVILFYLSSTLLQNSLMQQFIYDYESKTNNFNKTLSHELCRPNMTSTFNNSMLMGFGTAKSALTNLENKVQAKTSYVLLLLNSANTIPSVLLSVMYGAWTERVGRKRLLITSLSGFVIQNTLNACVVNYALPFYLLYISYGIAGACGSFSCILLGGFSYISDITDSKNRTFRIGVLEAMIFIGGTLPYFVSGFLIKGSGGYKKPFWGVLGLSLLALLYTVIVLPESKPPTHAQQAVRVNPLKCSSFKSMITMLRQRLILCVGLVAFLLIVFEVFNEITIIYLKSHPFCWSAVLVGIWYGLQTLIKAIGLIVGTKVFQRFVSDTAMILIGLVSWIASTLIFAMAKTTLVLFLSLIPGIFQAMSTAGIRTVLSKLTSKDKQGMIFSAIGMLESLTHLLSPIFYNTVYPMSRSLLHCPSFCFYISAGILALAIPLVVLVYYKGVLPMKYQVFVDSHISSIEENNTKINPSSSVLSVSS